MVRKREREQISSVMLVDHLVKGGGNTETTRTETRSKEVNTGDMVTHSLSVEMNTTVLGPRARNARSGELNPEYRRDPENRPEVEEEFGDSLRSGHKNNGHLKR